MLNSHEFQQKLGPNFTKIMKLDVITPSHINLDQVVMGYCVLEKLRILMVEMRGFFEIFFLKNNLVFWSKIFMIWLKMDVTSLNQSIFCRNSKVLLTCIVKLMLPGFPGIFSGNPGISRSREENISGRNANPIENCFTFLEFH